jgi:hypothetical protein
MALAAAGLDTLALPGLIVAICWTRSGAPVLPHELEDFLVALEVLCIDFHGHALTLG